MRRGGLSGSRSRRGAATRRTWHVATGPRTPVDLMAVGVCLRQARRRDRHGVGSRVPSPRAPRSKSCSQPRRLIYGGATTVSSRWFARSRLGRPVQRSAVRVYRSPSRSREGPLPQRRRVRPLLQAARARPFLDAADPGRRIAVSPRSGVAHDAARRRRTRPYRDFFAVVLFPALFLFTFFFAAAFFLGLPAPSS